MKLMDIFVMEYTVMLVVMLKVVMVEKLKYRFVLKLNKFLVNMSNMKSMRELVTV